MLTYEVTTVIVAIFVGVISKICYDWLASNNNKDSKNKDLDKLTSILEILSKTDSEGMPLIYVSRESQNLAKETAERVFETNIILKDIKGVLKENGAAMRDVMREMQKFN